MASINTLIKWPGGKAREIKYIEHLIPEHDRYIEPFFGGGAMFFHLKPQKALINDISSDLIDFYLLIKEQNQEFKKYLLQYSSLFNGILEACEECYSDLLETYKLVKDNQNSDYEKRLKTLTAKICEQVCSTSESIVLDASALEEHLYANALDKMKRTVKNEQKAPFSNEDLKENLITGFTSGVYMYFRGVYNDTLLGRNNALSKAYRSALFYFIREYCYGSMFRYNRKGEFNIPYGGMSYNRKDFKGKIDEIFNNKTKDLFSNTKIHCEDFDAFITSADLNENDFMFLDPPYDTDFSDYEGREFTKQDQSRLAETLKKTKAKFILIIKNTDYIYSLYEKDFNILCFDKTYTYNVRSRNERNVEHLIITNIPDVS